MLEQPIFGQRLKQLRLEHQLSQAALAGNELSAGYLSRLESGARPPTERIVAYLAERLGVPETAFEELQTDSLAQVLASVASAADDQDTEVILSDALAEKGPQNPALRWQALWLLARMKSRRGQYAEESEHLEELTRLADDLNVPELRARARNQTARCMRALGENGRARVCAAEAFHIAQRHQLSIGDTAAALLTLVSAEAEAGRLPDARAHADELCSLAENAVGALPVEALWASAVVRIRQGDAAGAQALLEQALGKLDSHDDLRLWMRLRLAAASLYLQIVPPRIDVAFVCLREAETALALVGTQLHQYEFIALQAHLAFHEGRTTEAGRLYTQVKRSDIRLSFRDRVRIDILGSQLLILDGKFEEGIHNLKTLAKEASDALNVDLAAEIWRTLAEYLANDRISLMPDSDST